MNRKRYTSDPRYSAVLDNMDLLGITDVSTTRQAKNGTIVWKLPIKNHNSGKTCIEVASFSTGYVRNQNSGYSNYQLNKRKFDDEYFQAYEWKNNEQVKIPGQYRKWSRKTCVLIPIEIDRLEYLISYCLKNYYIKHANFVANGDYIPKWTHEWELERLRDKHSNDMDARQLKYLDLADGRYDKIQDLEKELSVYKGDVVPEWKYTDALTRIKDLENKLDTIKRIADYE